MARHILPMPVAARRLFGGVSTSSDCRQLRAAVVSIARGAGGVSAELVGSTVLEAPRECIAMFQQALSEAPPAGIFASFGKGVANALATSMQTLLQDLQLSTNDVTAVGVYDAGFWTLADNGARGYRPWCDASQLAETLGVNVVDAFPLRDLARGGLGGPILTYAEWVLTSDPVETRALVHLNSSVRLTYLPAATRATATSEVFSFDVGPGLKLLDMLVSRLTSGAERFDAGGRNAVQGRKIAELLDHWLRDPYFDRALPRWHPWGIRPERYLMDALQMANEKDWSVRDILCTATHLIAEGIGRAIERRLPLSPVLDRVLLAGGGAGNGMLLREITKRVAPAQVSQINDLRFSSEALAPASAAVLASCFVAGAAISNLSGMPSRNEQLLGRLTPGSRACWLRMLDESNEARQPQQRRRAG